MTGLSRNLIDGLRLASSRLKESTSQRAFSREAVDAVLRHAIEHITASAIERDELRAVLAEARDLFAMYAESHRARGPEHAEKAARNEAMAAKINAALAASPETAR